MKKYLVCISLVILMISCSSSNTNKVPEIDRAIQTLSDAIEPCEKEQEALPVPNLKTLEQMDKISNDILIPYIKYQSHINFQSCLEKHGALPIDYFINISLNKDENTITKQKAKEILKLQNHGQIKGNIDFINNLTQEERKKLNQIEYLNLNFDLLTVSESLANYRSTKENR